MTLLAVRGGVLRFDSCGPDGGNFYIGYTARLRLVTFTFAGFWTFAAHRTFGLCYTLPLRWLRDRSAVT